MNAVTRIDALIAEKREVIYTAEQALDTLEYKKGLQIPTLLALELVAYGEVMVETADLYESLRSEIDDCDEEIEKLLHEAVRKGELRAQGRDMYEITQPVIRRVYNV